MKNSFTGIDFSRDWRFDTEAIYSYSKNTSLSFGVAYAHDKQGNFEFGGFFPAGNTLLETIRPYARIDRTFENSNKGYLQWFSNIADSRTPSLMDWRSVENDIEVQLNVNSVENHSMSAGGNIRFIHISSETDNSQDIVLNGEPYDEQLIGLFLVDNWQVTDRVILEGQIRGDWYSETQKDWSARASVLYALDEQKDHVLRFSFSRAYRTPLCALRQTSTERIPLGVCESERDNLSRIVRLAEKWHDLTVGDMEGFAKSGGMINLVSIDKKIGFEINVAAAEKANLKVSSKLLKLSKSIYDS